MLPHIRFVYGLWECQGKGVIGMGANPSIALKAWCYLCAFWRKI